MFSVISFGLVASALEPVFLWAGLEFYQSGVERVEHSPAVASVESALRVSVLCLLRRSYQFPFLGGGFPVAGLSSGGAGTWLAFSVFDGRGFG